MSDLDALVSANIGPIVGLLVIALAILAGALAVVARRARRVESQLASLTRGQHVPQAATGMPGPAGEGAGSGS